VGCSGQGIPEPNHDHKLDASTDTPQINRRPDWLRGLVTQHRNPDDLMNALKDLETWS
jgi:hypothetical protein